MVIKDYNLRQREMILSIGIPNQDNFLNFVRNKGSELFDVQWNLNWVGSYIQLLSETEKFSALEELQERALRAGLTNLYRACCEYEEEN